MAFPTTSTITSFTGITAGTRLATFNSNFPGMTSSDLGQGLGCTFSDMVSNVDQGLTTQTGDGNSYSPITSADQEAWGTLNGTPDSGLWVAVFVRLKTPSSVSGGYGAFYFGGVAIKLYKFDSLGALTQLTSTVQTMASGDGLGISCVGTTITSYKRVSGTWSQINQATDSTTTGTGNIGLGIDSSNGNWDDFGGGTIVGAGLPPTGPRVIKQAVMRAAVR